MAVLHSPHLITECCARVAGLSSGDAAEIGVYRGEALALICDKLPSVTVHGYDTFSGFPDRMWTQGLDEHHPGGAFGNTSEDDVRKLLGNRKYVLHVGVFDGTQLGIPLRFVHIDCDLYLSTKVALCWAWKNLVEGGLVLCDDYGCGSCKGAIRACNEFIKTHRVSSSDRNPRMILEKI